jgi:hypothetical protein
VTSHHLSDRDALDAAIAIVRKHAERWEEFLDLVRQRGWEAAAMVAAYDCQARSMRLRWWELPPCVAGTRGKGRAARLLRRMLRRGVSRWHPRPLEAIAEAGPVVRMQRRRRSKAVRAPEEAAPPAEPAIDRMKPASKCSP